MSKRTLSVYFNNDLVGHLVETHGKFYNFEYIKNAKHDISITMLRGNEPFDRNVVKAFFENLLPEGEVLDLISKTHLVSKNNPFSLLTVIGEDCAGAISLTTKDLTNKDFELKVLNHDFLNNHLISANSGLTYYEKGMRLSIAGVQNKTTIYYKNEKYYIPSLNFPSSHILKFQNRNFKNLLLNEYFCTLLASELKFDVSDMKYVKTDNGNYLKIKRYDRKETDGKLIRLHQEDFAQLSGTLSSNKYEGEGGPGFKRVIEIIKKYSSYPIQDTLLVAKILVFNYLIGNNDYHSKNLAFLHDKKVSLTPFYDLTSTKVYPDLTTTMAMRINKVRKHEDVTREDIIAEFNSWNLKGELMLNEILDDFKNIKELSLKLSSNKEFALEYEFISEIINEIDNNLKKIS